MTQSQDISKPRRPWLRKGALFLTIGLVGLLVLVSALPWIVEIPWVQGRLAAVASRVLAPSAVRFDHIGVSWSRPIEIKNLVLRDAQGDDIVSSPTAHLSWNLRETLLSQPDPLTLTLDHASVDIERLADGTIDLLDTLKPILKDEPDRTILVRVVDGKLRFQAAGLKEPFYADRADIDLDLNAYPQPNAWRMKLERAVAKVPPGTVQITGSLGRKTGDGQGEDLELKIVGDRWPWVFTRDDVQARGLFNGTIAASQKSRQMAVEGDAQLLDLNATGKALSGDEVRLETVTLRLKLKQAGGVWTADRLDVASSLGKLTASGSYPPAGDRSGHVEGKVDLAALAAQLPRTLRLRKDLDVEKGALELHADLTAHSGQSAQSLNVKAGLSDLTARHGDQVLSFRDPATLVALLQRKSDSLDLEQLDVTTPFLTATGRGDMDRGINVTANVDLDALTKRLHEWLETGGLQLGGQGKISARYQRVESRFEGSASAEFKNLAASGLPAVETLHRDKLMASLKVKGGASPSGFPNNLRELSLAVQGDGEELKISATAEPATRAISANLNGWVEHVFRDARQKTEVKLAARWGDKDVILDTMAVAMVPVVGPGGQFLPGEPARWSGKGKYDIARDELTIAETDGSAAPGSATLAIAPKSLRAGGLKTREAAWFEASIAGDLSRASLGTSAQPIQLAGRLDGQLQARQNKDGWDVGARVNVHDLRQVNAKGNRQVLADEASASLRARIARKFERLDFTELALVTPYGRVEGAGNAKELTGSPSYELSGTVSPDWKKLSAVLAREVEPNASISGTPRSWHVSGTVPKSGKDDWLAGLSGELGVNLEQVDVFGMRLGRAAVVVHAEKGKIKIDPIDSTLNSGRLHLEPELIQDKQGLSWVHLGPTSGLMDAVVNDEVSHRVLMFAAPVLDQATRVRGRVSLALSDAYFPLGAGKDVQPKVDGDVFFDSVEFMPGPLADQILRIFRQESRPLLVLRDPVSIRIIGRTIYQKGLIIPLGNVAAIGIDGTVDFDQNLNLVASFAVAPPRKEIPVLSEILEHTQIQVPITGTFKQPRINGDALAERFKDMGVNLLDTVIGAGVNGLGRILQGRPGAGNGGPPKSFFPPFVPPAGNQAPPPPQPGVGNSSRDQGPGKNPNAPAQTRRPPDNPDDDLDSPTGRPDQRSPEQRQLLREQRKARRLDKRAERRMRRGLPPE